MMIGEAEDMARTTPEPAKDNELAGYVLWLAVLAWSTRCQVAVVGQENIETVHAPKHIQAAGALCMDRVAVLWSVPTAHRPRFSGRLRRSSLCRRRQFQSCSPNLNSPVRISDNLAALSSHAGLGYVYEPPFVRRGVHITNFPLGTTMRQVLNLITVGPLESVDMNKDGTQMNVFFLNGVHAAQFVTVSAGLVIGGSQLHCAWLPERHLDPIVALAVSRDRARRTLILYKHRQRSDGWDIVALHTCLFEAEDIAVRGLKHTEYREMASVTFRDISSAITAHARLQADPSMLAVHVMYGRDQCERVPEAEGYTLPTFPHNLRRPTYFSASTCEEYRPFTTVTLSNLSELTNVHDICKRAFGGPLHSVDLHTNKTADVTFFLPQNARDFYVGATTYGFTLLGNSIHIEPRFEETETPASQLSLTETPTQQLFSLPQIASEFSLFGLLHQVYWAPKHLPRTGHHPQVLIAFARAADAHRARTQTAFLHSAFAERRLVHAPDPCARPVAGYDQYELDRPWLPKPRRSGRRKQGRVGKSPDVRATDV
ncbi:hypothetical protein R3P38DRAFT_3342020 [Favolaschia claudopus]|uniref:Uncharacterized protein n=1 Tax=Favolaschia claudopus TaxID=2862362 RepID=A0AAW0E4Y4_9AGAR